MTPQGILLPDAKRLDWESLTGLIVTRIQTANEHEQFFIRQEAEILESGHTHLPSGYADLFIHLAKFTDDKDLVKTLAIRLHCEMHRYLETFYDLIRLDDQDHVRLIAGSLSGADFLERLERNLDKPKLTKLWRVSSMPRLAYKALAKAAEEAGKPPGWIHPVLDKDKAVLLLKRARQIASEWRNAKPERDRIIVELLRAYRLVTGKKPITKTAQSFIGEIDKCYRHMFARFDSELDPHKKNNKSVFGGALSSKNTFPALIKQSLAN